MSKHTPGPWQVRAGSFCKDGVPKYEVLMNGERTLNANDAKLIGAAPDLLEALKQILGWRELRNGADEFPIERIEGLARAAIAKATTD